MKWTRLNWKRILLLALACAPLIILENQIGQMMWPPVHAVKFVEPGILGWLPGILAFYGAKETRSILMSGLIGVAFLAFSGLIFVLVDVFTNNFFRHQVFEPNRYFGLLLLGNATGIAVSFLMLRLLPPSEPQPTDGA